MPAVREALQHDGQPVESSWSYLNALPADLKKWKPPKKIGRLYKRLSKTAGNAYDEVWKAVEKDKPTLNNRAQLCNKVGPACRVELRRYPNRSCSASRTYYRFTHDYLGGMTISPAFFTPGKDGMADANEPVIPDLRHAVVAVAIGKGKNKKLILVRNSWGDSWGLSGHAWLSRRYLAPRIRAAVTIK